MNMRLKLLNVVILFSLIIKVTIARIPEEQPLPHNNVLPAIVTTTSTSVSITTPELYQQSGPCFTAEIEICSNPEIEFSLNCDCFLHPKITKSLICCNVTNIDRISKCALKSNSTEILNLHIINATLNELDVSRIPWNLIQSLAVTDGQIKKITKEFARFTKIKCINFSNNNITEINPRILKDLNHLQILNMSNNNLHTIPSIINKINITVDIQGNNEMLCSSISDSLDRGGYKFVAPDNTFCLQNSTFSWFNTTDRVTLTQIEMTQQLNADCPKTCKCANERINFLQSYTDQELTLFFSVKVDCSGLGLTILPKTLPTNTISLNISQNKIKSLSEFTGNPAYQSITSLFADDNLIETILELEGTNFIKVFQQLYLSKNKLKSIPFYLISNTIDRNPRGIKIHLGGNRLYCDCKSAKLLKPWLLARTNYVIDYDKILCDNIPQRVVDLVENKLCQSQRDWTDYIFFIIAAEVLLLMGLIMKVSYDYWIFKTAGYLPWPANKMPKLPCDWLCES